MCVASLKFSASRRCALKVFESTSSARPYAIGCPEHPSIGITGALHRQRMPAMSATIVFFSGGLNMTRPIARNVNRQLASLVTALVLLAATLPAYAGFTSCLTPDNTATTLGLVCGWDQTTPAGTSGAQGAPNWNVVMTEPGTPRTLRLALQHLTNPHGEAGAPALTLNAGVIPFGSRAAGAGKVAHTGIDKDGNQIAHTDLYRYRVAPIPGPGTTATVAVIGKHLSESSRLFQWSFLPPAAGGRLDVTESKGNGTITSAVKTATIESPGIVTTGASLPRKLTGTETRVSGTLSPGATDYTIRYTIGDPFFSDTTLSFITGSAGSFEEEDLGLMTDFFVGDEGFFVPELFEANSFAGLSMQDLFVAVDLTQWLSFFDPFSVGSSPISISNGTSSQLPGFLIATPMADGSSPITFDPNVGYTVADPSRLFSGNVVIGGVIDGHVVPEPAILTLLIIGLAALGVSQRKRRIFLALQRALSR